MNTENKNYGYSISTVEHDGEKWVRVQALGEDFIIAPHDLDEGNDNFSYNTAKVRLKELGLDTFNRKQGFIIATLIDEINTKLEETGGDRFAEDWYVSNEIWKLIGPADYNGISTWFFNGSSGCFGSNNDRYGGYFRSRPVLAYPLGD